MDKVSIERNSAKLGSGEIHVWQIGADVSENEYAQFWDVLSEEERERAQRFAFDKDRRTYVLAHGALRELIGAYLGDAPGSLRFELNEYGKPFLVGRELQFNLSHSHEIVLCAFSQDCALGIDVELARPIDDQLDLAGRFFAAKECSELRSLPDEERLLGFFRCWTRKEAYIKALGKGLSAPLSSFVVPIMANGSLEMEVVGVDGELTNYALRSIEVGFPYVGALSYSGTGFNVISRCWKLGS